MLMLFSPLYLVFGLVFRSEQARLALALHQRVLILQRQLGKLPSLVPSVRANHRRNRSQWADIGTYAPSEGTDLAAARPPRRGRRGIEMCYHATAARLHKRLPAASYSPRPPSLLTDSGWARWRAIC